MKTRVGQDYLDCSSSTLGKKLLESKCELTRLVLEFLIT
uniref:Uncharacterized protein n=1 Tax=Anguilla anguilla TaxID=7936 RepID=A0A0E9WD96_ANGAN